MRVTSVTANLKIKYDDDDDDEFLRTIGQFWTVSFSLRTKVSRFSLQAIVFSQSSFDVYMLEQVRYCL